MSNATSLSLHPRGLHCSFYSPFLLRSKRLSITKVKVAVLRSTTCSLTQHSSSNFHLNRRSADYQPSNWNYDFLGSLATNDFKVEKYGEKRDELVMEVKDMLMNTNTSMDTLSRLELVDAIDRLGLKRHFQHELKTCVNFLYGHDDANKFKDGEDLYATALWFKVLRQHGYAISEDIFHKFKDQQGNIRQDYLVETRGLLRLYEASFLECQGDKTLEEIRAFAARHLKEQLSSLPPQSAKEVKQSLDMPLHWRITRLKARLSIEGYDHQLLNPSLITLAKLDYNMVQSCYKEEIKKLVRWWKEMRLPMKLPYMRDRLLEHYLWSVNLIEEPEYHHFREMATKSWTLITAIDDTYDVYGTLEELEIFTDLIDKWEINGINRLPEPMKNCFLAVYNTSHEISDSTFKEKGFHTISYMRKSWARLCNAYMQEARWYHEGYKPTLSEYIDLSLVSIAAHLALQDCYIFTTPSISKEAVEYINSLPNLVYCGSMVIRLVNDLGISIAEMARGDTLKAVQCYMHETGVCEEDAREHINGLIRECWKKMNEEYYLFRPQYPSNISEPFLSANLNIARSSQFFYSSEKDWHGKPEKETMDHMSLMFINPIPM